MPLPTFFNLPEEKRQRILDLAVVEFAHNDYNSASISKIVQRAGIAKGSLYQYFKDKRDLYHFLLELVAEKKAEMMGNLQAMNEGKSVFDTLRDLFEIMINFELHYPELAKIGNRAVNSGSPLPPDLVMKGKQSARNFFSSLIHGGQQRGEIKPGIDADIAAMVITSTLAELGDYLTARNEETPGKNSSKEIYPTQANLIKQVYERMIDILENGMAASNKQM